MFFLHTLYVKLSTPSVEIAALISQKIISGQYLTLN